MTASEKTGSALLVRIGPNLAALPLGSVVETCRPLPIQPLAGVPPYVRGVATVRGRAIPVVDLSHLVFDRAAAAPRRLVTIRAGARRVALLVDDVLGVQPVAGEGLQPPPPLLSGASASVASLGAVDRELLVVLEAAALVEAAGETTTEDRS